MNYTWNAHSNKKGPVNNTHVALHPSQFSRVQKAVPPKTQQIFPIPRKSSYSPAKTRTSLTTPATRDESLHPLQRASLELTSCPQCGNVSSLKEGPTNIDHEIDCNQCGPLPKSHIKEIRKRQFSIIQTAFAPHDTPVTPNEQTAMASTSHDSTTNQDTDMLGETAGASNDQHQDDHQHHHHTNDVVVKHNEQGHTMYIEDEPEGVNTDEALDVAWFAGAISKLDARWAARWSRMEAEVSNIKKAQTEGLATLKQQQAHLNDSQSAQYKALREQQEEEGKNASHRAIQVNQRLESLAQGQQDIRNSQDGQRKKLDTLKADIIADLQRKLDTATESIKQICDSLPAQQTTAPDSYAQRAAKASPDHHRADKDIPNYVTIGKRTPAQRPAATQTNGTLALFYVRDWCKEPVGKVKRVLML